MKEKISTIVTKIRSSKSMENSSAKTIHEKDSFLKLIELERDRVHRDGLQFTLLLIRTNEKENGKLCITELAQNLTKRVRKTDRIGWYGDNHLGVLLPNTANSGAQVFANKIRKWQKNGKISVVFETISYPHK
jgi:PleD family two-component response regulator